MPKKGGDADRPISLFRDTRMFGQAFLLAVHKLFLFVSLLANRRAYFSRPGKTVQLLFRKDELFVHAYLKYTSSRRDNNELLDVKTKIIVLHKLFHQTDGFRQVVSHIAVFDTDMHKQHSFIGEILVYTIYIILTQTRCNHAM